MRDRIYAKSTDAEGYKEPLAEHTLKDIKAARQLVRNLPFGTAKKRRIGLDLDTIIAFHDIGKAAEGFQLSLENDARKWGHRHEIISAVVAKSQGVSDVVAFGIITHHKTLPSDGTVLYGCLPHEEIPYSDSIEPVWYNMAEEWNENIIPLTKEWEQICNTIGRKDLLARSLRVDTPLSNSMKNWLSRFDQDGHFSFKQREYVSLLRGLTIQADHIMSTGDYIPKTIPAFSSYNIAPTNPYGYQLRVGKKVGNVILRAPTGTGKTDAALMWAQLNQKRNGRLFYTLPTTASLNAMYVRLKKLFGDTGRQLIGLLHSRVASSIYSMLENANSKTNQVTAFILSSLAREMYFPIRVCTLHQVLRLTLQGKGWELMLSEFPNSVFIFDEIHAYNSKLTGMTIATAKYIVSKHGTCIFLSATLPKFLRRIIRREIPDIDFMQPSYRNNIDKRLLEQKRHILCDADGDVLSNTELILKEANKARSTLIVCNHVPTAQQVYKELVERINDTVLLHSQFARRDRTESRMNCLEGCLRFSSQLKL